MTTSTQTTDQLAGELERSAGTAETAALVCGLSSAAFLAIAAIQCLVVRPMVWTDAIPGACVAVLFGVLATALTLAARAARLFAASRR